jgi:hypothetical protein
MGVNITAMSYRGAFYWGIHACPETVAMVWSLAEAIPAALDELLAAAGLGASTYRPAPDPVRGVSAPDRGDGGAAQGSEATAIDEAPSQTGMGSPKVADAGA